MIGATPSRSAVALSSPARSTLRTSTVTSSIPRSRNAASAACAVPPAPRTTARPPVPARVTLSPITSVFSTNRRPPVSTSVFAAPIAAAVGDTSCPTSSATRLSGMVSDSPAHWSSSPSTNAASPLSSHSWSV